MPINLTTYQKRRLSEALLSCSTLASSQMRQELINNLPSMIRYNVRDYSNPRHHVIQIIDTCLRYSEGIPNLLEGLKLYEGNSDHMFEVLRIWSEILVEQIEVALKEEQWSQVIEYGKELIDFEAKYQLNKTFDVENVMRIAQRKLEPIFIPRKTQATDSGCSEILIFIFAVIIVVIIGIGAFLGSLPGSINRILIPAGEFTMGSNKGNDNEKPAHQIYLNSYYIDKYEVTNAQYEACVKVSKCTVPHEIKSSIRGNYYGNHEVDNYPVIYVDWTQAKAYCEYAGKRLPTEAEWEKAARGTDGRMYPWGNELPNCSRLNYRGEDNSCLEDTRSIGDYPSGASSYGVMDMAGNVREWTSSNYKPYPYKIDDGREDLYSNNLKVVRGGAWSFSSDYISVSHRFNLDPSYNDDNTGFRCAQSAEGTKTK